MWGCSRHRAHSPIMAELFGGWSAAVGVMLVCLIPKPEGGRRPTGLLPSVIRWWMRARLDIVGAWQTANDRAYFYAGPRKGVVVELSSRMRYPPRGMLV